MAQASRRVWHEQVWFRHGVLLVVISLGSFGLARTNLLMRFEAVTYDRRMAGRHPHPLKAPAVVCAIDDEALRQFGRWPWPRDRMAEVVRMLVRSGAKGVLLDIEYSERSTPEADAALALALRESRRGQGVAHLQVPNSETERLIDRIRERLARWMESHPDGNPSDLTPELAAVPGIDEFIGEARLRSYVVRNFGATAEQVAKELKLDYAVVNRSIESIRTAVLRKEVDRSVRANPEAPLAVHEEAVCRALSIAEPDAYREKIETHVRDTLSGREVLRRWGLPAERFASLSEPWTAPGMSAPVAELTTAFDSVSFSNFMSDGDGVSRHVPLVWSVDGRFLRHPGLTLAMQLRGADPASLRAVPGPALEFTDASSRHWTIPVDDRGQILINWCGDWNAVPRFSISGVIDTLRLEKAFLESLEKLDRDLLLPELQSLSLSVRTTEALRETVLEDSILKGAESGLENLRRAADRVFDPSDPDAVRKQQKRLQAFAATWLRLAKARYIHGERTKRRAELASYARDKFCFVGSSATALTDFLVTPYQTGLPGVGIHVNALDTIVQERYLHKLDSASELALIVFLVVLSGILFAQSSLQLAGILGIALLGADWVVSAALLATHGLWVPVVGPWIAITVNCALLLALRYFTEVRQKHEVEKMFGYYLSPEVIEQLRDDPSKLRRGGEEVEITALFTDLAGFSTVAEQMKPAQVVDMINDYLGECTDVLVAHHGTLERYEGDAIRAMFGAPIHHPDHAVRACLAGLEMQHVVARLRDRYHETHRPEFKMRLGLNSGQAIVGNIGARNRFNFTMQGDSVNLASRLEGANKVYGTGMILGEKTYAAAKDAIEARELDFVRVAGRASTLHIYELLGKKGEVAAEVLEKAALFDRALGLYRTRRWEEAAELFLKLRPDPVCDVYLARCSQFAAAPPPASWDCVFDVPKK